MHGFTVYRNGDCFHSIFAVRSGLCKSVAICSTGQEKITGFHLPGELFGLSGITSGRYSYDAIAVEDSDICIIPFLQLLKLSVKNTELQLALFKLISAAIRKDQGLLERLESLSAEERIIAWLLNLSERYSRLGYSAERFPLAMSRRDAANYLGIAHETVSRVLSRLRSAGLIRMTEKDVQVKDRNALLQRAGEYQPA